MDIEKILPEDGPPINEVTKYIEKYKNDLIVIKYGGNVLIDRNVFNNFIIDLSVLNKLGLATVVIHGGGPRIKRELEKSNIQSKFIRGLRVTDKHIIDIVESVLIDFNKWQATGRTNEIMSLEDLSKKWEAFNWHTQRINGHNLNEIYQAIENAKDFQSKPSMIIADTIKGLSLIHI